MSRRWDNKEVPGRGTKYCLVIDPEDGTHPIRTYGWSVEEVLDKVANTAETAQQVINRQRAAASSASPNVVTRTTEVRPTPTTKLTPDEQMRATSDLSDPAKSPEAIGTLLRGVGIDVNKMKLDEDIRRVAATAQEWEKTHPDFPASDKNNRLLLDKATLMVGFPNINESALDAAFAELSRLGMLFEAEVPEPIPNPSNAQNGNSATREERPSRTATSYRSHSLRSEPAATANKPRYTRAEIDKLTSKQLRDKIEYEPGFREWYDSAFSRAATA